jgi:hypothetical protein
MLVERPLQLSTLARFLMDFSEVTHTGEKSSEYHC